VGGTTTPIRHHTPKRNLHKHLLAVPDARPNRTEKNASGANTIVS
jgi:hypothetical protein